ncbi:hypothetical protein ABZ467_35375 [Streptomyces sp. NPDC005727]|uniref:hypothetical protein n=1 Tax=Streptomyces sp. NPDC005727 TaxID=3157053 RepID=UPI0033E75319
MATARVGVVALDETASAQLDVRAERYRAATAATAPEKAPREAVTEPTEAPLVRPEAGAE